MSVLAKDLGERENNFANLRLTRSSGTVPIAYF